MTLFVNACVRSGSRTKRLADRVLSKEDGPVTELRLSAQRWAGKNRLHRCFFFISQIV